MKRRRVNLPIIISCGLIIHSQIVAQSHPPEAEENPLSTVVYLLSTTDKDDDEEEKVCLAKSLANVGRFGEVRRTMNMVERGSYVEEDFVGIVQQLIEGGKNWFGSVVACGGAWCWPLIGGTGGGAGGADGGGMILRYLAWSKTLAMPRT